MDTHVIAHRLHEKQSSGNFVIDTINWSKDCKELIISLQLQKWDYVFVTKVYHFFYFQFDPSKDFAMFARISYDAFNERLSIVEELDEDKEKKFYEYILLHREVQWEALVI